MSGSRIPDRVLVVATLLVAITALAADESMSATPQPRASSAPAPAGRMTPEKYADYVRLFSAGDHRYASYYDPYVVFSALPATHPLRGRQAILDLYDGLHKQLTEELTVTALAIDNEHGIMAAELTNRIVATTDQVRLPSRTLNKGDVMVGSGVVFYGLSHGLITSIREAASGAAPIRLAGGDLFGIVLIFRDITDRKLAEEARGRLAAIVESSDDAIISKTLEGIVTSWNQGATRLFGYEPGEIIGRPITTIVPPDLHDEEREILAKLRQGERIEHFETVRVGKNGGRVEISLSVSPVRDEDGHVIGASKIGRDISARKKAEAHIQESSRRKDEFLATLSHELRNPLAPIRSVAELLKRTERLPPDARAAATILERQVRHMTHLINDLLAMSRITSGQVSLQRESLDLVALVTAAIESYRPGGAFAYRCANRMARPS